MHSQIINHKDKLYLIKRIIKERSLNKSIDDYSFLREAYHSDVILKKDGLIFFVEEINEPNIIE